MSDLRGKINNFFESINRKSGWYILFLVLINVCLKIFQISDTSIWLDEAHTATQSLKSISEIIVDSSKDQNPPLYFILMHFWTTIFGISEFGIRFFSLCLSVFSVALLFFFARKYFNIRVAFISSILFTFSEQQIYFSLEARVYALIGLLCILSFSLFYKLIDNPIIKTAFILGLTNALLIYSHFTSCFIIVVQVSFALIYSISRGKKLFLFTLLSIAVTSILFIPWINNLLNNAPKSGVYWLSKPTFYNLKGLFISFSNGKVMTVLFALIILFYLFLSIRHHMNEQKLSDKHFQFLLLIFWFLLPVITDYCLSDLTPIFLNKYLLYSSIGLYLLIGFCLSEIRISESIRLVIISLTLVLFIISSKIKVKKTEDWRGTVQYIKTIAKPRDVCILSSACISMPFSYYYNRNVFTDYKKQNELLIADKIFPTDDLNDEKIKQINPQHRLILIESHPVNIDSENSPLKFIEKRFHYTERKYFGDINVFVFEKQ